MALDNKNRNINLFDGNAKDVKVNYNLLLLTLWEIRNKSCEISYAIESIRKLGVQFERYDTKDSPECCDGEPPLMTEKELDDFYINISIISDHYRMVTTCLEALRLMGIQQDCFQKQRRKKYERLGLPSEPEENVDPDGSDDPRQGSLF